MHSSENKDISPEKLMKNYFTNEKPQNILVLSCQKPKMQCLGLTPFNSLMTEIPIIEKRAY